MAQFSNPLKQSSQLGGRPQAAVELAPEGALVCEIGLGREKLEAEFPALPLIWLDTTDSEGEVFLVYAKDFPAPAKGKRR